MPETKKPLPVPAADRAVQPGEPVALVRRRLLHGGLAAGPVLMTLVSRPVLGSVQCVTPSAFISGNASIAGNLPVCTGFSPDDWVNNPNWPPPFTPDTPFCDVFGPSPPYCCDTFIDVIAPVDTSPPDPPAPTEPAGRGRKHRREDGTGSKSNDSPSSSRDRWTLNQGPTGHKQLDLGSLRPKTLDLGASDQQTFDLGALGQKRLNVGSANQHVASADQSSRRNTSQGGEETNQHSHQHGQKHRGQSQDPGPSDPPPPDPIPVDPLGCNSNDPAPTPDPVSDPPPPTSGGKKRKSKRHANRSPQPNDDLARHVVSAALNAQAGLTPPLTVHIVKGMWRDYITQGYYEPTAGVQWSKQDILTYLASTQPA